MKESEKQKILALRIEIGASGERIQSQQNGFGAQPGQVNQNFGTMSSAPNTMSGANNPNYHQMSTREELDDRFRRGGFFKEEYEREAAQNRAMPAQQQSQQSSGFDTALRKSEQLASAAYNGLSGGFIDEIGGTINGLGYGVANLGMQGARKMGFDVRTPKENAWEAMQRGYQEERDYRRGVMEQGRNEMPVAMAAMEMTGAIASPLNKILPNNPGAPLAQRASNNALRSSALGTIYGVGNTEENRPEEYAKNIGGNIAANVIGHLFLSEQGVVMVA